MYSLCVNTWTHISWKHQLFITNSVIMDMFQSLSVTPQRNKPRLTHNWQTAASIIKLLMTSINHINRKDKCIKENWLSRHTVFKISEVTTLLYHLPLWNERVQYVTSTQKKKIKNTVLLCSEILSPHNTTYNLFGPCVDAKNSHLY